MRIVNLDKLRVHADSSKCLSNSSEARVQRTTDETLHEEMAQGVAKATATGSNRLLVELPQLEHPHRKVASEPMEIWRLRDVAETQAAAACLEQWI